MNVEHIPAKDVDMLPCGADWQSRHLESEKRKAEIRDRIHKQAEQGQKTAKDYFRPAKPTPSIYDSDLKRVAVYARVMTINQRKGVIPLLGKLQRMGKAVLHGPHIGEAATRIAYGKFRPRLSAEKE